MTQYPAPPSHIGKQSRLTRTIDGLPMRWRILDEVVQVQSNYPRKAIYLQRISFEPEGRNELRLCYWIVGEKPGAKGRWVFGESATMMPIGDFRALVLKAIEKGWLKL